MTETNDIFIDNATNSTFELYDLDNNHYGTIRPIRSYSLMLNFSSTFEKGYKMLLSTDTSTTITFTLSVNGIVSSVQSSSTQFSVFRVVDPNFGTCACACGSDIDFYNRIVIDTGGITAPSPPQPLVSPGVLWYDYY